MEQNNYLEFEKSKAAVYTIMEAFFQDVFDLEDDELGSFHDEIDEYMKQNQEGSWLPENLMITDRFYEWLFEELPYFYVGHFLELLFLLMHDLKVYIMLDNHLENIRIEINCMLDPLGCEEPPEWEE